MKQKMDIKTSFKLNRFFSGNAYVVSIDNELV